MLLYNIIEEQVFLDTVQRVVKQLSVAHKFGIYDADDIGQEIYCECLRKLSQWDKKRPLFNFLLVVTKNHLLNIKRNEFYRPECPCRLCNDKDDGKTGHTDGKYCAKFLEWKRCNLRKANIAFPPSLPDDFSGGVAEDNNLVNIVAEELQDKIDLELPVKLRGIYLRMKSGEKVSNVDKEKVLKSLKKILKHNES